MRKIILTAIVLLALSCRSTDDRWDELKPGMPIPPPRSTSNIRLDDIEKQIQDAPVTALNLIYIFKEVYLNNQNENEDRKTLLEYESRAIESLVAMQKKAIEEERWDEAASFSRSLSSIGVTVESSGLESDLVLADAKKKLADNNTLGAFLAAVKVHEIKPLDQESALLFLEKAVEAKQRRTAAFFLSAAENAGAKDIPAGHREYARGRDNVSDMVKGVATVIVDKGIRIEKGRGMADRMMGSAFFVDSSGLMITNHHVIAGMVDPKEKSPGRMYIRMGDATSPTFPARVIGWDKALDLALIKTEMEPEYIFSVVDRVIPRVGDTVLAIGSPLGLEKTVTSGIVSTLGRRILQIGDVYQIDAAVNQGNSGGPVVDNEGRLVGIVFAGIMNYQGLNFAIPAERLVAALPVMMKGGKAERPWLGVSLSETLSGAEIIYTAPNTPAARHLIREGSIVSTINGKEIKAPQGRLIPALQDEIFQLGPGELVAIETVDSSGVVKKNVIMTAARPNLPLLDAAKVDRRERLAAPLFGLILSPAGGGVFSPNYVVSKVVRGSVADESGISQDDPISIIRFRVAENEGYALIEISVKKRRMGYLEINVTLPSWLDSPDTL
jgi:S1-C subfamily serine protease